MPIEHVERRATRSFPVLAQHTDPRLSQQAIEVAAPPTISADGPEQIPDRTLAASAPLVTMLSPRKIPVSRHVVDLKEIAARRAEEKRRAALAARPITEQVFSSVLSHSTITRSLPRAAKQAISKIRLPKPSVPTLSLPPISLPRVRIPRLSISFPRIALPTLPHRRIFESIGIFAIIALVFTLPFQGITYIGSLAATKGTVLGATASAVAHMQAGRDALSARDTYRLAQELSRARTDFQGARDSLHMMGGTLVGISGALPGIGSPITSADVLLDIATVTTSSAESLAHTISAILEEDSGPTDRLAMLVEKLDQIMPELERVTKRAETISITSLPAQYQQPVTELLELLPRVYQQGRALHELGSFLLHTLGTERPQRYLLIFQNDNELRPTGGFVGSFAHVEVQNGVITKLEAPAGGSYDLQGSLTSWIATPKPLRVIEDRWQFHDANWFPHFPDSARQLMWFYEASGGTTVDGVIAINASVFERLLAITGPLEVPDSSVKLTAENAQEVLQQIIRGEAELSSTTPKKVISDLLPHMLDRIIHSNPSERISSIAALYTALEERELQLFFTDPAAQSFASARGWSGEQRVTSGDYLSIVSTNIAGGKTDAVMRQEGLLTVSIAQDGSIINTLTITKRHTGDPHLPFQNIPNVDYLRIYVPQGSELLEATGFNPPDESVFAIEDSSLSLTEDVRFDPSVRSIDSASKTEIYTENGKTVFANWMQTGVGATTSARIVYRLPFTTIKPGSRETTRDLLSALAGEQRAAVGTYSLYIQKQSGRSHFDLFTDIKIPHDAHTIWQHGNEYVSPDLKTDRYIGLIYSFE